MTRPTTLPESSFVPVTTRRLNRPELLWQDDTAQAQGFDPERVFCSPTADDLPEAYTDETRVEWADCYGGIGVGAAGGSGRCAAYGGLQTKGVGATSLVAHDADRDHSSGVQSVFGALPETLFGLVYQAALPFGAVPTLAMLLVHQPEGQSNRSCIARALTVRPFVLRPAHFMRNLLNLQGRQPEGAAAPGHTRDAYRVTQALSLFAAGLQLSLGLDTTDPVATVDLGLRELTRRLAWQFAAGFAKRLPHGSACCSNLSLAGQYMDYGMSQLLPTYRRPTDAIQDPWTESQRGLQTVVLLRQQLEKYFPGLRGSGVASANELSQLFAATLEQRLGVEMAKMAGLTEDLAQACPAPYLAAWLKPMRDIWRRGGQEPLAPCGARDTWGGLPVDPLRPDLNQVFVQAGPHGDAEAMDQAIAPLMADGDLRARFVAAAMDVRQALWPVVGGAAGALDTYLAAQAQRKSAVLPELMRDDWFRIALGIQMEAENFEPVAMQRLMSATVARARHMLADLAPDLPGASGIEQIQAMNGALHPPLGLQPQAG